MQEDQARRGGDEEGDAGWGYDDVLEKRPEIRARNSRSAIRQLLNRVNLAAPPEPCLPSTSLATTALIARPLELVA